MADPIRDVSVTVNDAMAAVPHVQVQGPLHRYKPMRGQAYVQLVTPRRSIIWQENERERKWHMGRVLALGPPCRLSAHPSSAEVPWDVEVGDRVIVLLTVWMDRMRVLEWVGVDGEVAVVAQGEILAVCPTSPP